MAALAKIMHYNACLSMLKPLRIAWSDSMSTVPLECESQIRPLCTQLELSCSLQDTYRYHREEAVRHRSCGLGVLAVSVYQAVGPTNY